MRKIENRINYERAAQALAPREHENFLFPLRAFCRSCFADKDFSHFIYLNLAYAVPMVPAKKQAAW